MSSKSYIKKIWVLIVVLVLSVSIFSACKKIIPNTVKTETWEGNQTLDQILDAIAGIQDGGSGQNVFSMDGEFEVYLGDTNLILKVQAFFDLTERVTNADGTVKEPLVSELLLELRDKNKVSLIAGVYIRGDSIYVSSGSFNLTLNKIDIIKLVGGAFSAFFDMDVKALLGGIDIGMDITAILGGFLFPSARVVTEAPVRGQNGDTVVKVVASMDIDTVVSVVLGVVGMVNGMIPGVDLSSLIEDATGTPLLGYDSDTEFAEDGVTPLYIKGYVDILGEYLDLENSKPFKGSTLSMTFTNGALSDFKVDGTYTAKRDTENESQTKFGFIINQFDVSKRVISIKMPAFISTFDIFSIRLGGEGNLPDIGAVTIDFDIRLDPKNLDRNQIVFEVHKKDSGEIVFGGYYKDGFIYVDLSKLAIGSTTTGVTYFDPSAMGLSYVKISGVDLQKIMDGLVGDIGFIADNLTGGAASVAASPNAVYDFSINGDMNDYFKAMADGDEALVGEKDPKKFNFAIEPNVTLDFSYILGLLTDIVGLKDGRVVLDLQNATIMGLLDDFGINLDDLIEEVKRFAKEIVVTEAENAAGDILAELHID
ncbi:MAG: hypothetical protein LBT20_00280, partial [Clostridiales bacterium]|nr:hypothetical protein [Clostridiales bacterium]